MFDDKLKKIKNESFYFKTLPNQLFKLLKLYFRLEVENADLVPKKGSVLIVPNHSGFSGLDAVMLNHVLVNDVKRVPRVLTHKLWFTTDFSEKVAKKMGFFEANYENGLHFLKRKNAVVIFPEGEAGNFKPSRKMYSLQEFKRGFIRMAIETQSPIVPTLIIGAEETNFTLKQLTMKTVFKGLKIPLPLNLVPLPAKWRIIFLEPIYLPYDVGILEDHTFIREIAADIQELMQERMNAEIRKRGSIYF
jgi:1-acyl-sn-glycerol-3-phosphate acyltransferase